MVAVAPTPRPLRCVLAAALLVAPAGCGGDRAPGSPPPPPTVVAGTPLVRAIVEWDAYTGRLEAIEDVEVRSRVSGYLLSAPFQEGKIVERGDLLFEIDPRPFQAAVDQAAAAVEEAQASVGQARAALHQARAERDQAGAQVELAGQRDRRARTLAERDAIASEEVDVRASELAQRQADLAAAEARVAAAEAGIATAEARVATARTALAAAELDLAYTRVTAPARGLVGQRLVSPGSLVSGGSGQATLLTTLVSLDPIHCAFDANEASLLKYLRLSEAGRRGSSRDVRNPVYLALADERGFPHYGHVDFVDNRVSRTTGTIRAWAIFENPGRLLQPGMFARLRIPGSGRYEAVLIPDTAVGSDQAERFVYVVDQSGSVARRPVELGPSVHGLRVVRAGLEGGETVVLRGIQLVRPGAPVQVRLEEVLAEEGADDLPDEYEPWPRERWIRRDAPGAEPAPPDTAPAEQGDR